MIIETISNQLKFLVTKVTLTTTVLRHKQKLMGVETFSKINQICTSFSVVHN